MIKKPLGTNQAIVRTLEIYGNPIPVAFLARELGRVKSELRPYIDNLQERGVVEIHEGGLITLT